MAEHNDNQRRRMLFTDFDVSDKGRPVSVLTADPPPGRDASLPAYTIADLAASLELDFEDDEGFTPSPRPAANGAEADDGGNGMENGEEAKRPVHFDLPGEDQELSLEQAADLFLSPAALPPPLLAVPTWEEFTNAFRAADRPPEETPELLSGQTAEEEEYTGAADVPAESPAPPAEESGDGVSLSAPTAAYDPITDDDEDVDILSFLSGPDVSAAAAAPRDRVRPATRAPEIPYGGVERVQDWFQPPEGQPEPPPSSRDWYEPPEEEASGAAEDLADTVIISPGGEDRLAYATARRLGEPNSGRIAAGETSLDIFSDFDVESSWSDRMKEKSPLTRRSDGSDTRSLDMFSDIDLETMWKSRRGRRIASDSVVRFAAAAEAWQGSESAVNPAGKTTILDKSALALPGDAVPPEASSPPPAPRAAAEASPPRPADSHADILAELDNLEQALPGVSPQDGTPGIDPTDNLPAIDVLPPSVDDSDIQDMAGAEDAEDAAEATGDHDSFDVFGAPEGSGILDAPDMPDAPDVSDTPDVSDALDALDALDDPASGSASGSASAAGVAPDAAVFGRDSSSGEELPPYVPRRFAAGNLTHAADFEAEGVDAGVMPPVVGDGDIDSSYSGPRTPTEEMRAIMGEDYVEGDGEAGEGVAADADVAVNPMDAFANMDDMDFSDDMDDDMRAMLDEENGAAAAEDGGAQADSAPAVEAVVAPPSGILGKIRFHTGRALRRVLPMAFLERVERMVAWRENWWFYCDLLAAIIASASLAVIISYYVWFA